MHNIYTFLLHSLTFNVVGCVCVRCTCVVGEVGTRIRCEIADDNAFCLCVITNNGDESQVNFY